MSVIPVSDASTLWIAFSGGVDSTALLCGCVAVHGRERCKAIHIDHGLHPESRKWAEHCRNVCERLNLPLEVETVALLEGNIELQARLIRYDQFRKRLMSGDSLVTAHHVDDVAETILWQVLTGRAPVGIAQTRTLGNGNVVRPFLALSKSELVEYAKGQGLTWIEDPSNADTTLDRNWIRHVLLPIVEERYPDARKRISKINWPKLPTVRAEPLSLQFSQVDTDRVRAWLLAFGVSATTSIVEEIVRQSDARRDSMPVVRVGSSQTVRRFRDCLYVVPDTHPFEPVEVYPGDDLHFESGELTWKETNNGFESSMKLLVCNRRNTPVPKLGLRINKLTKPLSSLFQEKGIAPWLRESWPVLIESNQAVCVPGVAAADGAFVRYTKNPVYVPQWRPRES